MPPKAPRDKEKDKAKAVAASPIWKETREVQVEELTFSLLREYMHRKGFKESLAAFDKEVPRSEKTIASRALMHDMMHTEVLVHGNKKRGEEWATIMEVLCEHRLALRSVRQGILKDEEAAVKECEELERELSELEAAGAAGSPNHKEKKKDKKVKDKDGEGKKKKKKKDKVEEEEEGLTRRSSARGWQPPGMQDVAAEAPVALIGVDNRNRDEGARIGFGGRQWAPPAASTTHVRSWMDDIKGNVRMSELEQLRKAQQAEVEKARKSFDEALGPREHQREDTGNSGHVMDSPSGGLGVASSMRPVAHLSADASEDMRVHRVAEQAARTVSQRTTSGNLRSPSSAQERSSKRVTFNVS
eukprot:Hpha_TRINITY_DN11357_c0_g1::TRINITY_DN11357_c0_g1_i1::g.63090::m.63090